MDDRSLTSGHVFIATSLDGFIARADHGLDWLTDRETGGEDFGYDAFLDSVDGLVMGRATYEKVLTFEDWPYPKPVVVMSRSLGEGAIPEELAGRVSLTTHEPPALMRELAAEGWSRAYVDGGKVIQSFLQHRLIEDLVLTVVPVLIGGGHRLFGELKHDIELELLGARSFDSGLVQTRYRVTGSAAGVAEASRTLGLTA